MAFQTTSGYLPNAHNPNTISEQNVSKRFTLTPSIVSENGVALGGPAGAIAYAINSVKFDPATAGRCDDAGNCSLARGQGNWSIEALGHNTFDFGDDMNHAHVQPTGAYHYHGMPELLIDLLGQDMSMTLVGWASDGFPVYARYGYKEANDSNSGIVSMTKLALKVISGCQSSQHGCSTIWRTQSGQQLTQRLLQWVLL